MRTCAVCYCAAGQLGHGGVIRWSLAEKVDGPGDQPGKIFVVDGASTKGKRRMTRPWMSMLGAALLMLGVGNLFVNMEYDTTTFSSSGSVHNVGKMDQRREWNANCRLAIVIGAAMIAFDVVRRRNRRI